jgi:3-phosphoshikimate 1-carboxyvinyltransferase
VKETDRIATLERISRRWARCSNRRPTVFSYPVRQRFHAAELDSAGDHRIAMAFAVAALAADGPCVIEGAEAASVSFPEFYSTLRQIAR